MRRASRVFGVRLTHILFSLCVSLPYRYIVLAMSIGLYFVIMPIFFTIFVVFRGAQIQKNAEDASEQSVGEEALVVQLRVYLARQQRRRVFTAWLDAMEARQALRAASVSTNTEAVALPGAAAAAAHDDDQQRRGSEFEEKSFPPDVTTAPVLPGDWEAVASAEHGGQSYYRSASERRSTWTVPNAFVPPALKRGGSSFTDENPLSALVVATPAHSTIHRERNLASLPLFVIEDEDEVDSDGGGRGDDDDEDDGVGSPAMTSRRGTAAESFDAEEDPEEHFKKKKKKKTRWKFDKKKWIAKNITVCQVLLDDHDHTTSTSGGGGGSAIDGLPSHLRELFRMLFDAGDRNENGKLSTLDLTFLLKARASGAY